MDPQQSVANSKRLRFGERLYLQSRICGDWYAVGAGCAQSDKEQWRVSNLNISPCWDT